jgi:formylglycine-generating enzyme required for sulfatase activity
MFDPVRDALAPAVGDLVAQPKLDPLARRAAAETLVDYARDRGTLIAEALLHSEPPTFEVLFGVAVKNFNEAVQRFERELAEPTTGDATDEELEQRNIRKSRAAAGLVRLGQEDKVWPLLVFDPQPDQPQTQDPSLRTEILHALAEYRAPWKKIVARLAQGLRAAQQHPRETSETSIQRALLVALGGYTGGMSEETRRTVSEQLQLKTVFETDPDPGLHSTCGLLLRRWGEQAWLKTAQETLQQEAQRPSAPKANEPRLWFINTQRQTFVVFPPGVFTMGSPADERGRVEVNEPQHRRRIERSFAIATTEVTRAQYAVFAKAEGIEQRETPYSKTADDPQTRVTWYDAVRYCNWLSQREGLQACYRIRGTGKVPSVTMEMNFLDLNGYRLPTEAEWEYACRGRVGLAWGHGRAERRLGQYAWFLKTSDDHLWPVGRLLPNEAGLFDMSGNGLEWCQDGAFAYPREAGEHATLLNDATTVDANTKRVLRGGSFGDTSSLVRAAYRNYNRPDDDFSLVGFRPSRTYP